MPAGKYRLLSWTINRKDAKGAAWELMGYGSLESSVFAADAAKPITLDVGEPLQASLSASERTNEVGFTVKFTGRAGESIRFERGNERPPGPKLTLVGLDGKYPLDQYL